jgi:hypothetical protein
MQIKPPTPTHSFTYASSAVYGTRECMPNTHYAVLRILVLLMEVIWSLAQTAFLTEAKLHLFLREQ